jgi:DNA repair protein RecO (recombination protein O)
VIALTALANAGTTLESAEPILRQFEHQLLIATGQTGALDWCTDQAANVTPEKTYIYHPERGICLSQDYYPEYWPRIIGQTLIDIMHNHYSSTVTLSQSKQLMRFILQHHLQGNTLNTRKVLIALQQQ